MKRLALSWLLAVGVAGPAAAIDFTGPVAPGNWAVVNTGTLTGPSPVLASAVFSTTQLVLTSGNSLSPPPGGEAPSCAGGFFQTLGPCQLQVTANLPGTYAFNWSYLTTDNAGPGGDIFGVIVDSSRVSLSDPGGANNQTGMSSFTALSSFGWFMNCTDCIGGAASSTVSQFNFMAAPIPEPETYALMLASALALAARLRGRRKNSLEPS